jgi:hypothetical protein
MKYNGKLFTTVARLLLEKCTISAVNEYVSQCGIQNMKHRVRKMCTSFECAFSLLFCMIFHACAYIDNGSLIVCYRLQRQANSIAMHIAFECGMNERVC